MRNEKQESVFTPLPPSSLRTAGPGLQESLHHYALRMADQCCMSLSEFELFLRREDEKAVVAGNARFPSSWIGPRSNFRSLLRSLERDTGVKGLHTGTFHVVADMIGRGGTRRRQIRGDGRAWCPTCYLQWDERSSSEPLVWAFDMLTACPLHGTLLETRCPTCNAYQGFSVKYRLRRRCQYCNSALGHDLGRQESNKQNEWVNRTLLEFTSWIGEEVQPITGENYETFLNCILDGYKAGRKLPKAILNYCRDNRSVARRDVALPTISTLLNLAAYQGSTIQAILCDPQSAASEHIFESGSRFEGLLFKRRDLQPEHKRAIYVLSRLAGSNRFLPPPSLVWLELRLWCDGVRDICPNEHIRYTEKYGAQRVSAGPYRFKRGVEACLRLLEKPEPKRMEILDETLIEFGYDAVSRRECIEASVNLWRALRLSLIDEVLAEFYLKRSNAIEAWAANVGVTN